MAILAEGWQSGGVYAPPIPRQGNTIKYFSFPGGTVHATVR